jgi:uncharacterized protein
MTSCRRWRLAARGARLRRYHPPGRYMTPDGFTNLRFAALGKRAAQWPLFPGLLSSRQPGWVSPWALNALMRRWMPFLRRALSGSAGSTGGASGAGRGRTNLHRSRRWQTNLLPLLWHRFLAGAFPRGLVFAGRRTGTAGSAAGGPARLCGSGSHHGRFTLDRGNWLRTGFNGLFMPVLEDSILAERAHKPRSRSKTCCCIQRYAAPDWIRSRCPVMQHPEQLAAVLVDVAALAMRLGSRSRRA